MENETDASGSGRSEPVVPQGRYIKLFMSIKAWRTGVRERPTPFRCDKLLTGGIESENILTDPTVCQSFAKDDRLHVGRVP